MIATLRVVRDPNGVLAIHEVWTDTNGVPHLHYPVSPVALNPEQLRLELTLYQRALDMPILTICNGALL